MARILVINSTTREGRFSAKAAAWVLERLGEHPALEVELLDLRDHPLPFFDQSAPAFYQRNYPTEEIARFGRKIDEADGYVILTAEYNHGYSAVLKNAMDHTFVEWKRKPITFVGWGNVGGARAVEQLREVAVEFEMAPLRHAVHILPDILVPAIQHENPHAAALFAPLEPKLTLLADDLAWWATTLAAARVAAQESQAA
jgi:NAD(P)H-dependent FMN reductase